MTHPDYQGGGIVNLMSSLAIGLDGRPGPYEPLALLPPAKVAAAAHVVLVVIDGLGHRYLQRRGTRLNEHLQGAITSVFPTSTAPAVTTFLTGVAPQQHGVTGWFMHLKEWGTVAVILPFRPRWGAVSFTAAKFSAGAVIAAPPLFNSLGVRCRFLMPRDLVDSPFSVAGAGDAERVGYHGLEGFFAAIRAGVPANGGRAYTYAYWPVLDALSHRHGMDGEPVRHHLRELEQGLADLITALRGSDTLLIVTADHGFTDTSAGFKTKLENHPELADCLTLPLCGEPRVAYCYVRPGRVERFERYVRDELDEGFDLHSSEELLGQGWFGRGEPAPCLRDRIGDYVLIGKDRHVIKDTLAGEGFWSDVGVHGGASDDEMWVPLVVAQC